MKRGEKGLESIRRMGTLFAALLFMLLHLNVSAQTGGVRPDFTASSLSGPAPLTVDFRAVPVGGADASYSWDFNTIFDTPGETASFTFEEPGEFAVTLTVQRGDRLRTATKIVTVTGGEPVVLQRPYTADVAEVGESVRITIFSYGEVYTDSATTVPIFNPKNDKIYFYNMVDETGVTIAMDVVIPGVKEEVHFDARNTVLATGLYAPNLFGFSTKVRGEIYKRLPSHPDFDAVVKRIRSGRQFYNSAYATRQIHELAAEVAKAYSQENPSGSTGTP